MTEMCPECGHRDDLHDLDGICHDDDTCDCTHYRERVVIDAAAFQARLDAYVIDRARLTRALVKAFPNGAFDLSHPSAAEAIADAYEVDE